MMQRVLEPRSKAGTIGAGLGFHGNSPTYDRDDKYDKLMINVDT